VDHETQGGGYRTLRESLVDMASAPLKRLRGQRSRTREDFWALKDVSFEVPQGEVVGIIGRNGAGKSTLLKLLSRITKPTTGRIAINGRVGSLLEVGTGFHPELSGRENIYLNGSILGMTRREIARTFDAIVDFAEIDKFLDIPVKRYSSGMYVRLAFAVAAHLEPEILIIDEVLAVGDTLFQRKCLGRMHHLAHKGRTVLFVSHSFPAVKALCSMACVLHGGKLMTLGTVDSCLKTLSDLMADNTGYHAARFDRPTGAPLWMESAEVLVEGRASSRVRQGDTLQIRVTFSSVEPVNLPNIGLVLYDGSRTALLNANTHYQRAARHSNRMQHGVFNCDVGQVPLCPGDYTVSLWLGDGVRDTHIVEHGLSFTVEENDCWGTGNSPPRNVSPLWWPTNFQLTGT
jgi:lipopolysaccharide transport system ATP-binding protein